MSTHQPYIRLGQEYFRLTPSIRLILAIEEELGALPSLLQKLEGQVWKVGDLVALVHILLEHEGREMDYLALGQRMVEEGLRGFQTAAIGFLHVCLQGAAVPAACVVRLAH